jgi:exosortase
LIALVVLWRQRAQLSIAVPQPSYYGVGLLLLAAAMHLTGSYFYSPWLETISLVPAIAGICWALGGWSVFRAALPAIAFMLFMIPLPDRLDVAFGQSLRRIATVAGANVLQTLGFFAQAEGNVIVLSDYELGIVHACNGLRMLMTFLATSTAVAILVQRSMIQRLIIVLSSIPLAILCNVIRIASTGIMHETAGHEVANFVYHDLAGWLMPVLALAFLGIELWILDRSFILETPGGHMAIRAGITRLAKAAGQA